MRIACIGDGRMGEAVRALAVQRGHEITAVVGSAGNEGGRAIAAESLGRPAVAIEFTEPSSAAANVLACLRASVPVVTGTTGWYDQLPEVEREVERLRGAVVWAPNFSVGVNLFLAAAGALGALMRAAPHFDARIIETHHAAKKDAPSGTAGALASAVDDARGSRPPITSIRLGAVPGTHVLLFDGEFEQIALTHEARDRRVFADGALRAAEWLAGRHGMYTMRDVLRLTEANQS